MRREEATSSKRRRFGFGFLGLGLASALAVGSHTRDPLAASGSPGWIEELNRLAQYVSYPPPPKALRTIEATSDKGRPEVRALRAALLYRADPRRWASDLAESFAIRDYAARARGETNDISQEDFVSRIKKVESSYPSLTPQVMMLVAFVELREANLWFAQNDQRVSVARFLRGAFLAQVFKGTSLDAVAVANQLDVDARKAHEQGRKPSR
jgi:hypothetical protein